MVLLKIDARRIAFLELERDAPGTVDVNGIAKRLASQCVKVEARNFHIFGTPSAIKSIEAAQATIMECLLNAGSRRAD